MDDASINFRRVRPGTTEKEYWQMRLKHLKHHDKPSVAVFFTDQTDFFSKLALQADVLEQKNKVTSMQNY